MGSSQPEEAVHGRGTELVAVLAFSDVEKVADAGLCVHCDLTGELGLVAVEDAAI